MPKRTFVPDFASLRIPYLGMPDGMIFNVDIPDLPTDAEVVWLPSKTKHIERLVEFRQIRHISATLQPDWLPILAALPKLESVNLTLPKSAEIPSLACLRKLRSLVLRCNKHQENLDFLADMDRLHSLCVSAAIGVKSLAPVATLSDLREIYLDGKLGKHVLLDSFKPLAELTQLQFAVLLVKVAKHNRSLEPLHALKKLNHLHLAPAYKPEQYDALLAALPKLKEIHFSGMLRWPPTK